jgi:hypothetical protein
MSTPSGSSFPFTPSSDALQLLVNASVDPLAGQSFLTGAVGVAFDGGDVSSYLTQNGCPNASTWAEIANSVYNSMAGVSGLFPPPSVHSNAVLFLLVNASTEATGVTSFDLGDSSHCGHGSIPVLPLENASPGEASVFVMYNDSDVAGTEGAIALFAGPAADYTICAGWYDPKSGNNGCAIDGPEAESSIEAWYKAYIADGGSPTAALPNPPTGIDATTSVSSTAGPYVTQIVAIRTSS